MTAESSLFTAWESFYVIVGSSGAALTGLQFVVMALIAERQRKGSRDTVNAFGTPTVVHFCIVLTTAAIFSAPWHQILAPVALVALSGLGGIAYAVIVTARARRQEDYKPVLEDWIWHCILPLIAYTMLFVGAIAAAARRDAGLFAVAAANLLLLLIGIHNSWDSIAYVATEEFEDPSPGAGGEASP